MTQNFVYRIYKIINLPLGNKIYLQMFFLNQL
jgi:hypothetical protein